MPITFQSRRRPSSPAPAACARTRQPRGPCTISGQPVCISRTCERGGYQHLRGGEAKNLFGLLIRKSIRTPAVGPLPSDGLRGPPTQVHPRPLARQRVWRVVQWPHTTTAAPAAPGTPYLAPEPSRPADEPISPPEIPNPAHDRSTIAGRAAWQIAHVLRAPQYAQLQPTTCPSLPSAPLSEITPPPLIPLIVLLDGSRMRCDASAVQFHPPSHASCPIVSSASQSHKTMRVPQCYHLPHPS